MISIYCIEDINGLKYIGSTKQDINKRLKQHKSSKDNSSKTLDLEQSVIYEIERCHENERIERERYWINEIECVNKVKYEYNHRKSARDWAKKNRERMNINNINYYMRLKLISDFLKMLDEY